MNHFCFNCNSVTYMTYYQAGKLLCKECLSERLEKEIQSGTRPIRDNDHLTRNELIARLRSTTKSRKDQ